MEGARIDKWLWAVRIFKTRTLASEACRKGRVMVGGIQVKPSHQVRTGDRVSVRKPPVTYTFEVLRLLEKRVGARDAQEAVLDLTPRQEMEMLEMSRISGFIDRARGLGRPTKKDRRDMDAFTVPTFDSTAFPPDFGDLGDDDQETEE